jgi:hypothetical protein
MSLLPERAVKKKASTVEAVCLLDLLMVVEDPERNVALCTANPANTVAEGVMELRRPVPSWA